MTEHDSYQELARLTEKPKRKRAPKVDPLDRVRDLVKEIPELPDNPIRSEIEDTIRGIVAALKEV